MNSLLKQDLKNITLFKDPHWLLNLKKTALKLIMSMSKPFKLFLALTQDLYWWLKDWSWDRTFVVLSFIALAALVTFIGIIATSIPPIFFILGVAVIYIIKFNSQDKNQSPDNL